MGTPFVLCLYYKCLSFTHQKRRFGLVVPYIIINLSTLSNTIKHPSKSIRKSLLSFFFFYICFMLVAFEQIKKLFHKFSVKI